MSANGSTVLNFDDLTTSGVPTMTNYSPYNGVTFNHTGFTDHNLWVSSNPAGATPHSGDNYLINAYGEDSYSITFTEPVIFQGAWVMKYLDTSYVYWQAKEFYFQGYNGATSVGDSLILSLSDGMQWLGADFAGPVDKVVFRRNPADDNPNPGYSFYAIDDITFTTSIPPEEQIEETLEFIDDSVDDEQLEEIGEGASSDNRLNALVNMIENAGELIADGNISEAIQQLEAAYKKCDGNPTPPDFVEGNAASELATMIQDILTVLYD